MSSIGQILNPLYQAVGDILTFIYSVVPNYAISIALLTIAVMVLLAPLTVKSTRSMLSMQKLAPEIKKLQQKYKGDRQKLNEEMMKVYKENGVSPMGGCLPMVLQLPFFYILYEVIRGLTTVTHGVADPKYISHSSLLWQHLHASHGKMVSFGMDLSQSVTSHHSSFAAALPFYLMIAIAIALQYLQMRQLTARNPQAAAANPQVQRMQKFMPLIFAFIYISIPAAVNIYFIVSSLFRIGQQELMFRYDPVIKAMSAGDGVVVKAKEIKQGRGREQPEVVAGALPASNGAGTSEAGSDETSNGAAGSPAPAVDGRARNGSQQSRRPRSRGGPARQPKAKQNSRSQSKRPRKAR